MEMHYLSGRRSVLNPIVLALFAAAGWFFTTSPAIAQVKFYVDFASDLHNGGSSGSNAIPDWVDELDQLALGVGITPFTPSERATIESTILSQLSIIYAGYDITFSTTTPGSSPFDTLAYGKNNSSPTFTSLGTAPRDPANTASGQVAEIAPANFGTILDEFSGTTDRSLQISQIATALAGSGAHEVGHTLGLAHHNAYSHPSIHPGTYAATGGVQNTYIMATGPTGISELEREVVRSIDPWSKVMLDIAGGAAGFISGANQKLVATPITLDVSEEGLGIDAGDTLLTAKPMSLSMGPTSGRLVGFVAGNPDASVSPPAPHFLDIDMWKLALPSAGRLTAEIFSDEIFGPAGYNVTLTLIDHTGTPIIANDNVHFAGDVFNSLSDPLEQIDSLLLNIDIPAPGFYYLKVSPTFPGPGDVGLTDGYWLAAGFAAVPEPASAAGLLAIGALVLSRRKWSRK